MQEQALLSEFAVEEYFSKIFGKDLEEVVELSLVMCLLHVPLIALDKKLTIATMTEAMASVVSIPDMRMSAFFLSRVEETEAPSSMAPRNP